jgi:MFS family permease
MVTVNGSITLIALPDIFRGISLNPLQPGNTSLLLWLIVMRIGQGVGGAMLLANSAAILTDAFPSDKRGLALGLNQVAGIAGQFIGLILGGLLGPVEWRLVFIVSVPFGVFGTIWAYLKAPRTERAAPGQPGLAG